MTIARIALPCLVLLAFACTPVREPSRCRSGDECPAGSRCSAGVCGAAPRPVAALSAIHSAETYALITLDGTASHDPGGGTVVSHRWRVTATDAPCDPPAIASRDSSAFVRFGCEGDYTLSLVVVNDLGLESEVLTTAVRALPPARASAVPTGSDLERAHRCDGSPLRCTPTGDAVRVEAREVYPELNLTYHWSVLPPFGRPLGLSRRVQFVPDLAAPAPDVVIESDGAGISGEWIFRVEARDEYGAVGAGFQRLTISNQPPTIAPAHASLTVDHLFDAARSVFTAAGAVGYTVTDPDGDPVHVAGTWRHVGDGGARFEGKVDPGAGQATFLVEVPYATEDDPLRLTGGEDLARTVELVARDANDAEARAAVPILVANRPPEAVTLSSPTVDHRFDPVTSSYVATATLGTWRDPDGDPMEVTGGADPCSELWLEAGDVKVECTLRYDGVPAVDQLVGTHPVTVSVLDPWTKGAEPAQTVTITNRPPALRVTLAPPTVACTRDVALHPARTCADSWPTAWPGGDRKTRFFGAASFVATPSVSDPDGDPVLVTPVASFWGGSASPLQALCAGTQCVPFQIYQPAPAFAIHGVCPEDQPLTSMTASDGASSVTVPASPFPDC